MLIFYISQGSVVTHLRCSGKHDTSLVENLLLSPTEKELFLKSANISQSYERILSGTFLWPMVYVSVLRSVALGATRQADGFFLAEGLSRRQRAWPVGLPFFDGCAC